MKKMSYRYARNQRKKRAWFVFGAIFMIILVFTPFVRWSYTIIERPMSVAYANIDYIKDTSSHIFQSWYSKNKILKENALLKAENKRLKVDALRVSYLESFLEKTRHEQGENISATIYKKEQNHFLISHGSRSGVEKGNAVFATSGEIVGFVDKVYRDSAWVNFLPNNGLGIQGLVFPAETSLSFVGNGNALVASAGRDIEINKEDIVYTQEYFGLPIGRIAKVDFDPRDPVQKIYLAPLHSLADIQFVKVQIQQKIKRA